MFAIYSFLTAVTVAALALFAWGYKINRSEMAILDRITAERKAARDRETWRERKAA